MWQNAFNFKSTDNCRLLITLGVKRIPRHRHRHRHPRKDRREDVGVGVMECGLIQRDNRFGVRQCRAVHRRQLLEFLNVIAAKVDRN